MGFLNASRYIAGLADVHDVVVVMVGTPSAIGAVLSTIHIAFPNRIPHMTFVQTLEEAYSLIKNV